MGLLYYNSGNLENPFVALSRPMKYGIIQVVNSGGISCYIW